MKPFNNVPKNKTKVRKRKLIYGKGINDAEYVVKIKIDGKQLKCPYTPLKHVFLLHKILISY